MNKNFPTLKRTFVISVYVIRSYSIISMYEIYKISFVCTQFKRIGMKFDEIPLTFNIFFRFILCNLLIDNWN